MDNDEFLDKDHAVMDRYYEIINEHPELDQDAAMEMLSLIKQDPDFYDPYNVLGDFLCSINKRKDALKSYGEAYERATRRISDKNGNFPRLLKWGWLENRHIIRAIGRWAEVLWENGKNLEALEIFRKLFRANPNDNTGCRFSILALRMNLSESYLEDRYSSGNGLLDALKVEKWFDKNSKKFPEEFEWWFKYGGKAGAERDKHE